MEKDPYWYKDAIVYEAHVKALFDANNDGIGDFQGLTQKLDYLQDLGVTAIWLLPFYPSPMRDDGYDISDYRNVHPSYGTLRDFRNFVREAHKRGLRVITELVINHTSDQHAWFQRARLAKPDSTWRNYYVWSETDTNYAGARIIFLDTEKSNWAWDSDVKQYYWHRFYYHQPDLNFDNPQVLRSVISVMEHWLDIGVDGLRLDAVPYLVERDGTNCENLPETHAIIKKIRAALDERYPDRMLLAEANQWPEDVRPYFGEGDECHMAFHFPLMPRIYMALAQEDRHPITDIIRQTPDIPENCQWAIFLRNHDELTLEMVTDRERDYLWRYYAADARARLNLGIRRRLAPLLENDRRKIELLNSLLMSMPGTPVIYYGDEIGMGDNIFLGDRDGVRTPMQWSPDRNAGFSRADPARLYLPPVMDAVYGFEAVNVEAQNRSPSSLLNWMKRLIAARKLHQAFGRGTLSFLYPGNRKVLAYIREHHGETVLCVANLSRAPQPVELDLSKYKGRVPVELLGRSAFPPLGDLPYFITLPGYGFYWFLLAEEAQAPSWHENPPAPIPELLTLVMPQGWASLHAGNPLNLLEGRILPEFFSPRRWFSAKSDSIKTTQLKTLAELPIDRTSALITVVTVSFEKGSEPQLYSLPLSIAWDEAGEDKLSVLGPCTLARVRRGAKLGLLYDAMNDDSLIRSFIVDMAADRAVPTVDGGKLAFSATAAYPHDLDVSVMPIHRVGGEQSNTSLRIDEKMVLKLFRRLQPGIHPELEIGLYLTEFAHFANTPALLGAAIHEPAEGEPLALAVLNAYVQNQGDGWTMTLDYLKRFFEEADLLPAEAMQEGAERHGHYLTRIRTLGRRTAELHRAFALPTENPAFAPEKITAKDIEQWIARTRKQADDAIAALHRVESSLTEEDRERVRRLMENRENLLEMITSAVPKSVEAMKTRCHGDLHMGQVLVAQNDFYFVDFEGEPTRTVEERRVKQMPLRDVAGMLRSLDYAAASAQREGGNIRPESRALVASRAEDWRKRARTTYMQGYQDAIGDCPSYPADPAAAKGFLDLFLLEKALYEINYEVANRPSWVRIALDGVLEMIEQPS